MFLPCECPRVYARARRAMTMPSAGSTWSAFSAPTSLASALWTASPRSASEIGLRSIKPLPLQAEQGTMGGGVGGAVATLRFF